MSGESSLAFDVEDQPMAPCLPHQRFNDLRGGLEAHELLGGSDRARTTPSEGCAELANRPSLRAAVMCWSKDEGPRLRRNGEARWRKRDGLTRCYAMEELLMKPIKFTSRASTALIAILMLFSQMALADDPVERAEEECRAVLEQNFHAITAESWKSFQKTLSQSVGTRAELQELKAEAQKMFSDTDVYMRLVDFKLINLRPPMAEALVLQLTLPADEKDREPVRHQRLGVNFKHHSALLPEFELVKYRQRFRYENGEWKVHKIVSRPLPASTKTIEDAGLRPASRE